MDLHANNAPIIVPISFAVNLFSHFYFKANTYHYIDLIFLKDCKGVECYNGGVLDASTCKCKCQGLWSGTICDKRIKKSFILNH